MAPLEFEQLIDLEDAILDNFFEMLQQKNADGTLEKLLREMGMQGLLYKVLDIPEPRSTFSDGDVLIVGAIPKTVDKLQGIAKNLGIHHRRLVFVSYDEATNYPFDKLRYVDKWAAMLIGPIPHSVMGKGDSSSFIEEVNKHQEEYPPMRVMRRENGELDITNTNFRNALEELIARGIVAPG